MSRRLDPDRPLWEVYFVEGLEDGRVALLSKSHQILVDGISTVDLGPGAARRRPRPAPAGARRLGGPDRADAGEAGGRAPWPSRRATPRSPSARCAATPRRSAAPSGGAAAKVGAIAGELANRRSTPGVAVQRRALRPAAGGAGAHLAEGLPQGPPGARRHRQRRHPGHAVRRDPGVVHDPRRVGGRRTPAAGAGADERDRRGARADLARVPGGRPPRRPADRRGVARRTPAPGLLRPARAQRDRPGRGRRPDRRGRRASRRPPSTRSGRGWRSRRPAATSTW